MKKASAPRPRGKGFEFIGGMIVPLGEAGGIANRMIAATDGAPSGAIVQSRPTLDLGVQHVPTPVKVSAPAPASKPMNVVREAKKRRAEIRKQLRVMRKLEAELSQLDRLIKAAEQKPSPAVRSLTRSAS